MLLTRLPRAAKGGTRAAVVALLPVSFQMFGCKPRTLLCNAIDCDELRYLRRRSKVAAGCCRAAAWSFPTPLVSCAHRVRRARSKQSDLAVVVHDDCTERLEMNCFAVLFEAYQIFLRMRTIKFCECFQLPLPFRCPLSAFLTQWGTFNRGPSPIASPTQKLPALCRMGWSLHLPFCCVPVSRTKLCRLCTDRDKRLESPGLRCADCCSAAQLLSAQLELMPHIWRLRACDGQADHQQALEISM